MGFEGSGCLGARVAKAAYVPTQVGSPETGGRNAWESDDGGRTDLVSGPLQQQQPQFFQAAVDAVPAPLLHKRLQHLRPAGKGERADPTETQRGRAGVGIPPLG